MMRHGVGTHRVGKMLLGWNPLLHVRQATSVQDRQLESRL